jgi:integrase
MPRPRKHLFIQCQHFSWRLAPRDGVYYADGRSNKPNPGRHSLNTRELEEARKRLANLDLQRAVDLGLTKVPPVAIETDQPLALEDGRRLYENHIERPIVAGGVKASTAKRYRTVFNKFLRYAKDQNFSTWNTVVIGLVHAYAGHLAKQGYAAKTIRTEMITIVQAQTWLIRAKHLVGSEPIKLELRKVESERPYCYTTEQVAAMVSHCRSTPALNWLGNVIVALATTGLRIAELASLQWSDLDSSGGRLTLTDETGRSGGQATQRRQLKSGRSRSLPIHPELVAVLSTIPKTDSYVFHGPRRGRLKPDTVRQVLIREVLNPLAKQFPQKAGEKGFADGRLHSFRHYFASKCAMDSEISEYETMEWLGHSDSAMVRHYFHIHDDEAQRRMSRLNLLGEAGQPLPGVQGAATNQKEATSQKSDPKIAT